MEQNKTISDTMYSRIKKMLGPPVFEDEEKTRATMILCVTLWAVVAVVSILIITWLITGKFFELGPYAFVANTVIIAVSLGLLFLIRIGYVKSAGFIFVGFSWSNLTFQAFTSGGVRGSAAIVYMAIMVLAGLLLGWRASICIAALSTLSIWILAHAEQIGFMSFQLDGPYEVALESTSMFILTAVFLTLTTTGLSNALRRARKSEDSLKESNRALQMEHERVRESEKILKAAIEQSPSGILIADAPDVKIRLGNAAGYNIRGGDPKNLLINWEVYRSDGTLYPSDDLPLVRAVLRGEVTQGEEGIVRDQDGNDHWVTANAAPIRNSKGQIISGIVVFDDITERKLYEKELAIYRNNLEELIAKRTKKLGQTNERLQKEIVQRKRVEAELRQKAESQEVLVREVNHRVKNNLLAILGMLYKEQDRATKNKMVRYFDAIGDLINRIEGLSTVHSLLSSTGWNPLHLSELCKRVINGVLKGISPDKTIFLVVKDSSIKIQSDQSHHLTLVINELAVNTIKHALGIRKKARIEVSFSQDDTHITMRYCDDGPGYPEAMLKEDFAKAHVGFELIHGIVTESLRGKVQLSNQNGAATTIIFKKEIGM